MKSGYREELGWMRLSTVWALGLVPVLAGFGMEQAMALNAPHTLHHAKTAEPHLTEPHRTSGRHASAVQLLPAAGAPR